MWAGAVQWQVLMTGNSDIFLSVVIPNYNEEMNLRKGALHKVYDFLARQRYTYEVIVVDDGSTDQSKDLIKKFIADHSNFRLIEAAHGGKANAVITGVRQTHGEIVLFTDMDQATPIDEVNKLLPKFDEGSDFVIGSRGTVREGAPLARKVVALGMILLRTIILGMNIVDTQTGFKAFKRSVGNTLFDHMKLYGHTGQSVKGAAVTAGFDVEMLFVAQKLGFNIAEVPVEWHHVETRRVNPLIDGLRALRDLVTVRVNDLRGVYAK